MLSRGMILFVAALAFHAADARAQLFKCVGKDGKVAYQGEPCPPAVDERQIRAPAPGDTPVATPAPTTPATPAAAASGAKAGWEPAQSRAIKNDCAKDAYAGAQRSFGTNDGQFPEAQTREAVDKYCDCMVRRITTSITPAQFAQNRFDSVARVTGECKMDIPVQQ